MSKTVSGSEAISYLVSHTFYEEKATIEETRAFIDVDDAGRYKERESDSDYRDLMWTVMNYFPSERSLKYTGYTVAEAIEGLYTAEIEEIEIGSRTVEVIKWFHINTDLYDSESRGSHFRFVWEV